MYSFITVVHDNRSLLLPWTMEKNVPKTFIDDIEDIKWSLKCINGCVKAVNANVKNLQLRMVSMEEEEMSVFTILGQEMSKLKKTVLNMKKIKEEDKVI